MRRLVNSGSAFSAAQLLSRVTLSRKHLAPTSLSPVVVPAWSGTTCKPVFN